MLSSAFTTRQASELAGLPYATVGFLQQKAIVKPSIREGGARGAASVFSFADVLAMRCLSLLRAMPSTLETLASVVSVWSTPDGEELASLERKREERVFLIVTARGSAVLEQDATLSAIAKKHGAVLHVLDATKIVRDVLVHATEKRMLGAHIPPGPKGRVPRTRTSRPTQARERKRTEQPPKKRTSRK